jgi:hypothetical protein
MKTLITNYTFDASEQTITFSDYTSILLESVLIITNVTDNIIIYNFAGTGKGGSVTDNTLTLTYDTTGMDDGDDLQIYYDDSTFSQTVSATQLESLTETLQELVARLAPLAGSVTNIGGQSLRVTGVSMPSTAVTGPVTTAGFLTSKTALENLLAIQSNINNATAA